MSEAPSRFSTIALARWIAGTLCICYGFAKVNGAQFIMIDSELSKPLGEVSGFWLTWRYFGYSTPYKMLVALVEISGGILLMWPRTALLGALALMPAVLNIVLIDVFFGIDPGATLMGLLILFCLCVVIAPHVRSLRSVVLLQPTESRHVGRAAIVTALVFGALGLNWWARNRTIRSPTPIDGAWVPTSASGRLGDQRWNRVFFEVNRAHMAVFRPVDGADEVRHFEIDAAGKIRIWRFWLRMGDLLMEGRLGQNGQIELDTIPASESGRVVLKRGEAPRAAP